MATALDIVNRSGNLSTIYQLREASSGVTKALDEAEAGHFLLWIAVFGRKLYHGVVIDADFFDYVTEPVGDYLSRIEMFADMLRASGSRNKPADMLRAHHWYYTHGVHEFNLEIFITPRELTALAKILSSFDRSKKSRPLVDKIRLGLSQLSKHLSDKHSPDATRRASTNSANVAASSWLEMRAGTLGRHSGGVNLIGYAHGVLGIGEDIRASARALGRAGVPISILNVKLPEEVTPSETSNLSSFFVDQPVFPVNLFCMTLFETERMRVEFGSNIFQSRYNIGYWPWELPALPELWHQAFEHVDEIWAISPYLVDVYTRYTDKPVVLMPPGVVIGSVEPFDLSALGLEPGTFVFLTIFDFNSYMSRKNPIGAIDAFKSAFPSADSPERLVIKTINGDTHRDEFGHLLKHIGTDSRIIVVDGTYSRAATNGLIASADCLISLHRAEGLGRTIAEAMLLETPVVATNWSGSTSLLNELTGFPVAYALSPVPRDAYVFDNRCHWAEPLIDDAARQFRVVRGNSMLVKRKCAKARPHIQDKHGLDAVATRMANRLGQIASILHSEEWRPAAASMRKRSRL